MYITPIRPLNRPVERPRTVNYDRPWLTPSMKSNLKREPKLTIKTLSPPARIVRVVVRTPGLKGERGALTALDHVDAQSGDDGSVGQQEETHPALLLPLYQIMQNRNKRRYLRICIVGVRYEVVRKIALDVGFFVAELTDPWNIIWSDKCLSITELMGIRCQETPTRSYFCGPRSCGLYRRSNHFPGTNELCRKDALSRNAVRFASRFPGEFTFVPRTWNLPADKNDLFSFAKSFPGRTYICKPDCGAQGRGIFLTQNVSKLAESRQLVCQRYIANPLLIGGYKFDFRIYVQITSYAPLRVYIYNEGLARFATIPYQPPESHNFNDVCMHLTNYAVNKKNENYNRSPMNGSKRKMTTVLAHLAGRGFDTEKLMKDIDRMIVKTILSSHTNVCHHYNSTFPRKDRGSYCFELLGFDILVDENLKPWLLEVNLSPSFGVDLEIDKQVKEPLLRDTFMMTYLGEKEDPNAQIKYRPVRKQFECYDVTGCLISEELSCQFKYEDEHKGGFRLIYPAADWKDYIHLFNQHLSTLYSPSTPVHKHRKSNFKKKTPQKAVNKKRHVVGSKKKLKKLIKNTKPTTKIPEVLLDMLKLADSNEGAKSAELNKSPLLHIYQIPPRKNHMNHA